MTSSRNIAFIVYSIGVSTPCDGPESVEMLQSATLFRNLGTIGRIVTLAA